MAEIGLTAGEHAAVLKIWNKVRENFTQNGVDMFISLFTAYPDYQKLFHRCKDIPVGELAKTSYLKAHGTTFMHGLSTFMENLDDKETLIQLIDMNTERHFHRKITYSHFQNALALFVGFLKGKLGDLMDSDATNGWQKLTQVLQTVIKNKLDELDEEVD